MPTFKDFEKRIRDSGNYMFFIDHFVRKVVGCRIYDGSCDNELLNKYVTVSDEAYALVCTRTKKKGGKSYMKKYRILG